MLPSGVSHKSTLRRRPHPEHRDLSPAGSPCLARLPRQALLAHHTFHHRLSLLGAVVRAWRKRAVAGACRKWAAGAGAV